MLNRRNKNVNCGILNILLSNYYYAEASHKYNNINWQAKKKTIFFRFWAENCATIFV